MDAEMDVTCPTPSAVDIDDHERRWDSLLYLERPPYRSIHLEERNSPGEVRGMSNSPMVATVATSATVTAVKVTATTVTIADELL